MDYMTGAGKNIDRSMFPKRIVYARHGKTKFNAVEPTVIDGEPHWPAQGGGTDAPLNEIGIEQTVAIRPLLKALPIDAFFCSPLQRAKWTLNPPGYPPFEFTQLPDLTERDFGDYEVGRDPTKVMPASYFRSDFPSGEKLNDFYRRVAEALRAGGGCELPAFFGHGKFLDAVAEICCHKSLPSEFRKNATVLYFERKPGYDLYTLTIVGSTQSALLSPKVT